MRYRDRTEAGTVLGGELDRVVGPFDPTKTMLLGIARGGVPVAAAAADVLGVPFDVVVARKLGAPGNPELAIGAVVAGAPPLVNSQLVSRLGISESYVAQEVERQLEEAQRRTRVFRGSRDALTVAGGVVVIVDDGVATGATLEAAIRAYRETEAERVVAAVPVGPADTIRRLSSHAHAVVCPVQPHRFRAVGEWYYDFRQLDDAAVLKVLGSAHS